MNEPRRTGPADDMAARIAAGAAAVMRQTVRLHRQFGRVASDWKADGTRVTAADLAISQGIGEELAERFPADQFFSEELMDPGRPVAVKSRYCWVLDPIDGTNNYATGIAQCAISLALLEEGRPVYGIIYDLARRQLMQGGPGRGAAEAGRPLLMGDRALNEQSVIGFHTPYDHRHAPQAAVLARHYKLRGLGSSTLHLAYVACGRLDGVVDHNVKVWDIAAAAPLVLAAGGVVEFITPPPFPMRHFDLKMPRMFYVAGGRRAVRELRRRLGA